MIKAQIPARDITREHVFLAAAAGFATPSEFVEHCTRRLIEGEREFGARWTRMSLEDFARELSEEAADLGAWGALAFQAAELADLPPDVRSRVGQVLESVARRGAQAHHDAGVLKRLVTSAAATAIHDPDQRGSTNHG